jgi:hypothetical protein
VSDLTLVHLHLVLNKYFLSYICAANSFSLSYVLVHIQPITAYEFFPPFFVSGYFSSRIRFSK